MPSLQFQCPFCEQTSPRSQGLAAHIRNRHPKQYPKWLKTPSRLADAQRADVAVTAEKPAQEQTVEQPVTSHGETASVPAAANPALDLLKKAHVQLVERKQSIQADLARLADLTKELEAVNTQIEALDKTLGVF
jgi:small-conductance mechanosensitive channel